MAYTERQTYQLRPGDTILVHRAGPDVHPAAVASASEPATVLDPPLLHLEPSWYDEAVQLATLNTSAGPCVVSLGFGWLAEPATPQTAPAAA